MPRPSILQESFNGGELSPLLGGRVSTEKYQAGCERMWNMLPTVQGPTRRRPGTTMMGFAKTQAVTHLIPFEANTGASFIIECGANYLRFWMRNPNSGGPWPIHVYPDGSWAPVGTTAPPPPALPVISSFTATPPMLNAPGSVVLDATITGATSVTLDGAVATFPKTVALSATHTFTLIASNVTGATTRSLTVQVSAAPPPPPPPPPPPGNRSDYLYGVWQAIAPGGWVLGNSNAGYLRVAQYAMYRDQGQVDSGFHWHVVNDAFQGDNVALSQWINLHQSGGFDNGEQFGPWRTGAFNVTTGFWGNGLGESYQVPNWIAPSSPVSQPEPALPIVVTPTAQPPLITPLGTIAELSTPWGNDDLFNDDGTFALQFAQSNDVMWIVSRHHFPMKLERIAQYQFALLSANASANFSVPVPFKDQNIDKSITIWADNDQGSTLHASQAGVFRASDAGTYFYLEQPEADSITPWEVNKSYTAGDRVRSSTANYVALNSATSGSVKPTHLTGAKFDGQSGVQWQWTDSGFGVVRIISVSADGTTATASAVLSLPSTVVGSTTPSSRWARAAWNDDDGYPVAVSFFLGRLWYARGQTLWASVSQDFDNFSSTVGGEVTPDASITATIAAQKNDRILWLAPGGALIAGTASSEFEIGPIDTGTALSASNMQALPRGGWGSRAIQPVPVGVQTFYVQRGGRKVRSLEFDIRLNGYASYDVTPFAEHVTRTTGLTQPFVPTAAFSKGILSMAWQRTPDSILWMIRGDGVLVGLTLDREQQVTAWHQHPFVDPNGIVRGLALHVACIPSPSGDSDELWMTTYRKFNGVMRCCIEVLGPTKRFDGKGWFYHFDEDETIAVDEQVFLDCAVRDRSTVNGAIPCPQLAGTLCAALYGGAYFKPQQVTGQFELTFSGAPIEDVQEPKFSVVGFEYASDIRQMRLNPQMPFGTAQGNPVAMSSITVRVLRTTGFLYGPDYTRLERAQFRYSDAKMNEATAPFTGDRTLDWPGGMQEGEQPTFRQDQPFAMTIVAVMPRPQVEAR